MYYPFLRGRQNELLALQELLSENILSSKVVPVIEPVKLSPTLIKTIEKFKEKERSLIIIRNPIVGSLYSDAKQAKNERYVAKLRELLHETEGVIKRGIYFNDRGIRKTEEYKKNAINFENVFVICDNPDNIKKFNAVFEGLESPVLVPDGRSFRRINKNKILIEESFKKKQKNAEYLEEDDEFFTDSLLYYKTEGYVGFSDYSIIGKEYSESGFAPYAVAIHIVYYNNENELRIHHFVSDDNEDYSDPAGKFYQALSKLHQWNCEHKMDTLAIRQFEKIYETEGYPGLGVIKRLSIMHHLELVSRFMDGEIS